MGKNVLKVGCHSQITLHKCEFGDVIDYVMVMYIYIYIRTYVYNVVYVRMYGICMYVYLFNFICMNLAHIYDNITFRPVSAV